MSFPISVCLLWLQCPHVPRRELSPHKVLHKPFPFLPYLFIPTAFLSVHYFNKSECYGRWPGSLGSEKTKKRKKKTQPTNTVVPGVPVYTHHHLLLSYKSKQIGVLIHSSAHFFSSAGQTRQGRFVWIGLFELNKHLLSPRFRFGQLSVRRSTKTLQCDRTKEKRRPTVAGKNNTPEAGFPKRGVATPCGFTWFTNGVARESHDVLFGLLLEISLTLEIS